MIQSLVSVVIPTYNRKDYVQEAINSVLAQTYTNYEIIVVDDGSTDGTGEVLQARYGDRIRYVWQINQGESVARNQGIAKTQGEYIAFLDSDDLWLPDKLERQISFLQSSPEVGMVSGQAWVIDENGDRHGEQLLGARPDMPGRLTLQELLLQNQIAGPSTVMVRRSVLQMTGGFDPQIKYGEDWDLWLQVIRLTLVHVMNTPLSCIRRHSKTQCYYPESSGKISHVLKDHLRLVTKALDASALEIPVALQKAALARQYLEAYVAEVHVGTPEQAREYLLAVQERSAEMLHDMDEAGKLIVNQMVLIVESDPVLGLTAGPDYVRKVIADIREVGAADLRFTHRLLGQAYATLGFLANQYSGRRAARPFLINAIRHDLRWLRDTGLFVTIVKSFFWKHK